MESSTLHSGQPDYRCFWPATASSPCHTVATPNHALLISAGKPYRLSFPGCIGDRCLALRFSGAGAGTSPAEPWHATASIAAVFASHALLRAANDAGAQPARGGSSAARSTRWRRRNAASACSRPRCAPRGQPSRGRTPLRDGVPRRRARWKRVKEAVAIQPERKWTLGDLAGLASVSPATWRMCFVPKKACSVYQYVLRSRLAGALDAVLDSDVGLTEIALDARLRKPQPLHGEVSCALRAHAAGVAARHARGTGVRELRRIVAAPELGYRLVSSPRTSRRLPWPESSLPRCSCSPVLSVARPEPVPTHDMAETQLRAINHRFTNAAVDVERRSDGGADPRGLPADRQRRLVARARRVP